MANIEVNFFGRWIKPFCEKKNQNFVRIWARRPANLNSAMKTQGRLRLTLCYRSWWYLVILITSILAMSLNVSCPFVHSTHFSLPPDFSFRFIYWKSGHEVNPDFCWKWTNSKTVVHLSTLFLRPKKHNWDLWLKTRVLSALQGFSNKESNGNDQIRIPNFFPPKNSPLFLPLQKLKEKQMQVFGFSFSFAFAFRASISDPSVWFFLSEKRNVVWANPSKSRPESFLLVRKN